MTPKGQFLQSRRPALWALGLALCTGAAAAQETAADLRAAYSRPRADWPAPGLAPGVRFVELGPLALPPPPTGAEAARADLGRRLFADPILSQAGQIACQDCHKQAFGWGDNRPVSPGNGGLMGRRNTPALISSAYRASWPWDGRRNRLEAQVLAPLTIAEEMGNGSVEAVLARLSRDPGFAADFAALGSAGPITAEDLARALVAFLGQLEQPTAFDRFATGETDALDDRQILGLHLFRTRAGCANCHFGPTFSDEQSHNLGISAFGEPAEDLGRARVTGLPEDTGAFRTASLRHVGQTGPYMHSGLFETLPGIIRFYAGGGGSVWARNEAEAHRPLYPFAARRPESLRPFSLTPAEIEALAAFLNAI